MYATCWAGMDLEGHTGYLMVPSALVVPANALSISWNDHFSYVGAREDQNLMVAFGPIPYTELVARFASPDLSTNAKVGYPVLVSDWGAWHVGAGIQDLWGGARMFHSVYGVTTLRASFLESTLGWGTGGGVVSQQLLWSTGPYPPHSRLDGLFHGIAAQIPLPDDWHMNAALLEENDGRRTRFGGRLDLNLNPWTLDALVAVPASDPKPEFQVTVQRQLIAEGRPEDYRPDWTRTPVVLQAGPWAQTFLGTEVSDFDGQFSADIEAYVTPPLLGSHLTVASRVRQRILTTSNYEHGKAFAKYRIGPDTWWESGAIAWISDPSRAQGLLVQGGWTDGDWAGPTAECRFPLGYGFQVGATSGWWYSAGYDTSTWTAYPYVDWDSPNRSWFMRTDGGRFFHGDLSNRIRVGRRWGRLVASVGALRDIEQGEILVEGRLQLDLGGLEWNPASSFLTVRPVPNVGHSLRTRVALEDVERNWLRPDPGNVPALLMTLRN